MKKVITVMVAALVASLFSFAALGQEKQPSPKWLSERGYWVVESNIKTPLTNTVWFYNNDNVLVYKETVNGVRLNPARRKVRMKLKQALESAMTAWDSNKVLSGNKDYVAALLR